MNAPPYQKLFWGSYHKHTAHLRHARDHGAYLLLIGALWNNEGRLPADDATLAAYAMLTPKEWEGVKPKLMPLFKVVRGKLTQPRVTDDLAKYRDTSGKRKLAGKTGGEVSAENKRENRKAIAAVLPTKPEPEPEPEKDSSEGKPSAQDDPNKAAWDMAVQVLTLQGGMKIPQAKAFFGGLLAKNKPLEARDLLPSIAGALAKQTSDPCAYLTKAAAGALQRRNQPQKTLSFV